MLKNFLIKKPELNNKTILITGGTGSFGNQFVQAIVDHYSPKKLIIWEKPITATVSPLTISKPSCSTLTFSSLE